MKGDYARAAEFVNYSDVRLVSVQHEYGIFGGDDGGYVLDFHRAARARDGHAAHRAQAASPRSAASCSRWAAVRAAGGDEPGRQGSAAQIRTASADRKVRIIPHGDSRRWTATAINRPRRPHSASPADACCSRFGLLSPQQGHRDGDSRAARAWCAEFPDVIYFVVGATHPVDRPPRRRGLSDHCSSAKPSGSACASTSCFRDQFVAADELRSYLQATDVFISPVSERSSGDERCACPTRWARARPSVSTPYWHAQELLADGRGCLFPFSDHEALSRTSLALLGSPAELEPRAHRRRSRSRDSMSWPRIGDALLRGRARGAVRRHARAHADRAVDAVARRREQPARAPPRSPAAHDRRHRHRAAR